MRVIVNTSPLVVLGRIGHLHLLPALFTRLVRPESVLVELEAGRGKYGIPAELENPPWLATEPDPALMQLRKELGNGETAAITLAFQTQADLIILDDLAARLVAQELSLKVTGTLGVLLAAQQRGLITDMPVVFKALEAADFRVPAELRDRFS